MWIWSLWSFPLSFVDVDTVTMKFSFVDVDTVTMKFSFELCGCGYCHYEVFL